ncbi:hypothetical protein ACU4GD_36230 [Cupriavidus basilensis]
MFFPGARVIWNTLAFTSVKSVLSWRKTGACRKPVADSALMAWRRKAPLSALFWHHRQLVPRARQLPGVHIEPLRSSAARPAASLLLGRRHGPFPEGAIAVKPPGGACVIASCKAPAKRSARAGCSSALLAAQHLAIHASASRPGQSGVPLDPQQRVVPWRDAQAHPVG